jgi:hypothetical protein
MPRVEPVTVATRLENSRGTGNLQPILGRPCGGIAMIARQSNVLNSYDQRDFASLIDQSTSPQERAVMSVRGAFVRWSEPPGRAALEV